MSVQGSDTMIDTEGLQHAFDRTFAEAPRADAAPQEDLLAITISGDPYAMRLSEVGGLYSDKTITWLPGSVPELLGLVGLRGALLPAYDLRALLGYSHADCPRWCVVAADAPIVLGFEQFDGHLRVSRGAITSARAGHAVDRSRCVREVVHTDDLVRSLVHVPSVLEAIAVLVHHAARAKE